MTQFHQQLEDRVSVWAADYPGQSQTVHALRENLALADWNRCRARDNFGLLVTDLEWTGLPMHYWDRLTRRVFDFLEKHLARAQHEFRKALQILRSVQQTGKAAPPQSLAAPPVPETVEKPNKLAMLLQIARIKTVNGNVVVKLDKDQHYFLKPEVQALTELVRRQYTFENKQVPEQYQHVFEHNGVCYEHTDVVWITYKAEEFWRLCQLEIDSGSPVLLDGKRRNHSLFPDTKVIERKNDETNQEQN